MENSVKNFYDWQEYHKIAGHCILVSQFLVPHKLYRRFRIDLIEEATKLSHMVLSVPYDSDRYYLVVNQGEKCNKMLRDYVSVGTVSLKEGWTLPLVDLCGREIYEDFAKILLNFKLKVGKFGRPSVIPFEEFCEKAFFSDLCFAETEIKLFHSAIAEHINFQVVLRKDIQSNGSSEVIINLTWPSSGKIFMDDGIDYFLSRVFTNAQKSLVRGNPGSYDLEYEVICSEVSIPGKLRVHHHDGMSYMNPSPEAYLSLRLSQDELDLLVKILDNFNCP